MVAEKATSKPRRIGPQAVGAASAPADEPEERAEAEFSLETLLADLSTGEMMDLDEASGGVLARMFDGEDVTITLKFLFAVAWIVKRREQPRLSFGQVRRMKPEELGDVLNSLGGLSIPKAASAPAS